MTPVQLTNELRSITGDIQDKTDMHRTTNRYSCSLPSVSIFLHAQNFPMDADGHKLHITRHETNVLDMEGHKTNIDEHHRITTILINFTFRGSIRPSVTGALVLKAFLIKFCPLSVVVVVVVVVVVIFSHFCLLGQFRPILAQNSLR